METVGTKSSASETVIAMHGTALCKPLQDETVGSSHTSASTGVITMERCEQVQMGPEYVIDVVGSTTCYTRLKFFLLASTWFPRPLGVCVWIGLHMLFMAYATLMILILLPIVFTLAILADTLFVGIMIEMVFIIPFMVVGALVGIGLALALGWLWLLITCQCCTLPGRAPEQGLSQYICSVGGTIPLDHPRPYPQPEPAPVVEGGFLGAWVGDDARDWCMNPFTLKVVKHVIWVSFPYWRLKFGELSREIVPPYEIVVV